VNVKQSILFCVNIVVSNLLMIMFIILCWIC